MAKTKKRAKKQVVEIAASWSFKFSAQNFLTLQETQILQSKLRGVAYQVQDFFLSAKSSCPPEDMEAKTEALQEFTKRMVMKAVNAYAAELHEYAKPEKVEMPKKMSGFAPNLKGPYEE